MTRPPLSWTTVALGLVVVAASGCGKSDAEVVAEAKALFKASCIRQSDTAGSSTRSTPRASPRESTRRLLSKLGPDGVRRLASDRQAAVDPDLLRAATAACFKTEVAS